MAYCAVRRSKDGRGRISGWTGEFTETGNIAITSSIHKMKQWDTAAELYLELRDQPDFSWYRAVDLFNKPTDGFKSLWWYNK